ncbi:MAG: hypothetical protein K0S01_1828 [Herbinix sp.]|jgi:hypothetical protein|nr:hypothetical protein [Herbinix sp.]
MITKRIKSISIIYKVISLNAGINRAVKRKSLTNE